MARERDHATEPGSDESGKDILEEGKRVFREILGGSGLTANDPWLRAVQYWIGSATTQCWRNVPSTTFYGMDPTSKALIECTFERIRIRLDGVKQQWTGHVKAREKARIGDAKLRLQAKSKQTT